MNSTDLQKPAAKPLYDGINTLGSKNEQSRYEIIYPLEGRRLMESYRLRSNVFTKELRWAGEETSNFEVDEFDRYSEHLGVVDDSGRLVATIRFLSNSSAWLAEKHLAKTLPENFLDLKCSEPTLEVSRMSVDPSVRAVSVDGRWSVVDLLYKGIFRYCMDKSIYKAYASVSLAVLRHLRKSNMPAKQVGPVVRMPDGVRTALIVLDWDSFLVDPSESVRDRLEWFFNVKSLSLDASPWQLPENGSSQITFGIYS